MSESDRSVLVDARGACAQGDWSRAMTLLGRFQPLERALRVEGGLLLARAALRAELPERALAAVEALALGTENGDERAVAAMLRGAALVALGRLDEGLTALRDVAAAAHGALRAECGYELADAHRRGRRVAAAAAALDAYVDIDDHTLPSHIIARALELWGWIETRRGRPAIAARHFLDALDELERATSTELPLQLGLLRALAAVALDTLDLKLLARVRREIDTPRCPPASRTPLRHLLTIGELLDGRMAEAWRLSFTTLFESAAGAQRVAALVDAALIARAAGDAFSFARLIDTAAQAARHADWSCLDCAARHGLLTVSRDAAPVDRDAAAELMALYEALPPARTSGGIDDDGESEALAHGARAALAGADGRMRDERVALRAALEQWRRLGNRYAELSVLLALLETGPDDELLSRADELSRLVPRSWLRRRYESLAAYALGPQLLSPAERRVMQAIAQGCSTAQIAERFGRSKNTIRNQTRRVYTVMNVSTRAALVLKCAALERAAAIPGPSSAS